ncbi:MAG: ferritin-like domain-containing protein [Candidatus Binatia bacterium]
MRNQRDASGLRQQARLCIEESDLDRKVELTRRVAEAWRSGDLCLEADDDLPAHEVPLFPGLPPGLVLTSPTRVRRRGFGTSERLAAFVHAIAHIEWNAINLAWDAVWRFGGLPRDFYDDWTRVAAEEALHFSMLRGRLRELGSEYGRLPAHDGLWATAEATRHDLLARMALVPRVLEARGLDVTPPLISKLRDQGDEVTAAILEIVLRDEVGHVRIGSRWFHQLCRERGLEPAAAFEAAILQHFRGHTKAVHDDEARQLRLEAGFREDELDVLTRLAALPA